MFTGIIQKTGILLDSAEAAGKARRLLVETGFDELALGESVAVNGVCLTVAETIRQSTGKGLSAFFLASPETLARSNLGELPARAQVHLERALLAGSSLSGHIVQGHVDGIGRIHKLRPMGDCAELEVELPDGLSRYCVQKGSLAVDGVSLTVNEVVEDKRVRIMLIPHTLAHTRFGSLSAGDALNIEVDILAKYVEKLCQPYMQRSKA